MLMYFVGDYYSDQLCDSRKKQVGMECFFILSLTSSKPKAVFEMVDGTFDRGPDLVSVVPFLLDTPLLAAAVTQASMPEESKMVISALAASIAWHIGSVRTTRRRKTS